MCWRSIEEACVAGAERTRGWRVEGDVTEQSGQRRSSQEGAEGKVVLGETHEEASSCWVVFEK